MEVSKNGYIFQKSVDALFLVVFGLFLTYLSVDALHLLFIDREIGKAILIACIAGVPIVFFASLIAMVKYKNLRFKWYVGLSGTFLLILAFIYWAIFQSQI